MKKINNYKDLRIGVKNTAELIEHDRQGEFKLASTLGVTIVLLSGYLGAVAPAEAAVLTVPSGLETPSPLFGSKPFAARLLQFEEFGLQNYDGVEDSTKATLPRPVDPATGEVDCGGNPEANGSSLDEIIKIKQMYPLPAEYALTGRDVDGKFTYTNAWKSDVQTCDPTYGNLEMPMDGRPGDGDFKHQRWNDKNAKTGGLEFQPKKFFQSVQAGVRTSGGARDKLQLHGYGKDANGLPLTKFTEFGPAGLYHNTVTSPYALGGTLQMPVGTTAAAIAANKLLVADDVKVSYIKAFEGTSKGIDTKIDPLNAAMPVQDKNSVWTFDGTLPPKLLMARYGETILFRHHNALPIDINQNNGFGTHTISTHEHNGHNPAESDGFAGAYFYPGQFYDYRWPMTLAGHDTINTGATDKRAATPCSAGETSVGVFPCVFNTDPVTKITSGTAYVPGDYREVMSSHWFHDHMLDYTAQNVYKGNAAAMNYYSAIDRGNEEITDGVNLKFPSGTAKEWGNRDYDLNLVVGDKAFDASGQLYFNPLYTDGFLGDVMTVNWVYKPFVDVRARRYRVRILNGSVSRYFKIAVAYVHPTTKVVTQVPLHMIANDGNLLQHSVAFPNTAAGQGLPTQSIAERDDIIIDFAPLYAAGVRKVYLVNLMEHVTGAGPQVKPIALADAYNAFTNATKTAYNGTDLAIGKFMEFRLRPLPAGQTDKSMNPANYVVGKTVMQPLPTFTQAELKAAKHRTFIYGKKPDAITDGAPWTIETDGIGGGLTAKIDRISAAPVKNSVEIWHLVNNSAGWSHPAHIHFEEGQIIARDGVAPPAWEALGRKDMYRIGPEINSSKQVDVAIRIRDYTGTYVEHCHNTQHEDHAMLLRWDVETADHLKPVRTPYPEWSGVEYDDVRYGTTFKHQTADTGSTSTTQAKQFILPAKFGIKATYVPVTSAPAP